jgi:hypothetical protein
MKIGDSAMLWLTAVLIIVACIIECVGILAKTRLNQLRQQEACRNAFYGYVERLLSDPDTPEEVVEMINWSFAQATSHTFLWSFLIALGTGRIKGRRSHSLEVFKKIPDHLRADYVGLLVSFIFSLTYNNMLLGALVRRFILYSIPDTNSGDIGPVSPLGPMVDEFSRGRGRAYPA